MAYDAVMTFGISSCSIEDSFFTNTQLRNAWFTENDTPLFTGATGTVVMDNKTHSRTWQTTPYAVMNIQEKHGTFVVRKSCESEYKMDSHVIGWNEIEPFVYADGNTTPPLGLPPLEMYHDRINATTARMMISMTSFVVLSSFGFSIWTFWNRKEAVVRSSQPEFLVAIAIGVACMALAVLSAAAGTPWVSEGLAGGACIATHWFLYIGYSITFSALFAKTWRINKVSSLLFDSYGWFQFHSYDLPAYAWDKKLPSSSCSSSRCDCAGDSHASR